MKKGTKLRFQIHNILYDIHNYNKNLDDTTIKKNIYKHKNEDIAFINNVCLNSMRFYFQIKKIINKYVKKRVRAHEEILLVSGITQIVYLDFKEYAVIDCSVEVAKKLNIYHGFINAELKNISINKKKLLQTQINYSDLPIWFQKETLNLNKKKKKSFLKNYNQEPDLHVVFKNENKTKIFKEDLELSSKKSGFLIEKKIIENLSFYKEGNWWIQDFSSSLPLLNVDTNLLDGKNIDLCSAPGGKSFQILSNNKKIILNDKNKFRLKRVNENLKRLKFKANILNKSILDFDEKEKYDFIILDAPCSAVGTIRRNPEIFFKKQQPNLKSLISTQSKMLKKASDLLKKNGILLFMVCSFLQKETTNQISNFLLNNKDFIIKDTFIKSEHQKFLKEKFMYTLPSDYKGYRIDGYFATYLKKI